MSLPLSFRKLAVLYQTEVEATALQGKMNPPTLNMNYITFHTDDVPLRLQKLIYAQNIVLDYTKVLLNAVLDFNGSILTHLTYYTSTYSFGVSVNFVMCFSP